MTVFYILSMSQGRIPVAKIASLTWARSIDSSISLT